MRRRSVAPAGAAWRADMAQNANRWYRRCQARLLVDRDAHELRAEVTQAVQNAIQLGLVTHLRGEVRLARERRDLALGKRRREERPELAAHDDAPRSATRRPIGWEVGIHDVWL